ncbi:metalloendoproteinase 2-MMP-like isoform X2 [Benincasa hispida]|uniref:metalloendoproteinase 2-MMP-like isoform X2 n=1 Tax=Benincasa hispida TaxID=102211 RepID=UPI0018FF6566|nr:metalloendoproteinase 2-MMP-like isoform X2 [Benincasa hispida]
MALEELSFFTAFTLLILFLTFIPLISFSQPNSVHSHGEVSSQFLLLNQLHGSHKGDKVKGIHQLKKYLRQFGYLNYAQIDHFENNNHDEFDQLLESAIKTYQENYNLKVTGTLDVLTLAQMSKPRCGVADIIHGNTWMRASKKRNQLGHGIGHFHTVSHYAFLGGNIRWPKSHLTYEMASPISRAFATWAANSHFTFSQALDNQTADINIEFASGDHGDGNPFDGVGGVIAHSFMPPDGRFHLDADESWAAGVFSGSFDLETVALHEIGHLLGLQHSSIEGAIMWPSIPKGASKGLHPDDIAGIKALYGTKVMPNAPEVMPNALTRTLKSSFKECHIGAYS